MSAAKRKLGVGQRVLLAVPFLWLLLFFAAPFLFVAKISLSQAVAQRPPYEPVFAWGEGWNVIVEKLGQLSLQAYGLLFEDELYIASYLGSLRLAGLATLIGLCLAYPIALAMTRAPRAWRPALIVLAIAPFWTSFLIRVYAWIVILKDEGLLNHALISLGLIDKPLQIYATDWAVLIGIVYSYMPFLILPIYNAIDRQEPQLVEAARDLGASGMSAFWRVTFPLSLPGVFAGALLMFIPAVGEFVVPDLLGGSDTLMIGRTLWNEFFANRDWPTASAVAVVMLLVLLVPLLLYERNEARLSERRR
ncbi:MULTISPECIES: ABC transporter permease subunit [unclassified Beijerinckia]|uniref:ABC transporter permease n=1 Tax=unclassified Beijerinckia TaxID=2638183 RepID=UPI00089B07CC|nr:MULTISPECIES: ABC transporter permease subunit [unclassified Beijerinckia]MDH7794739.1 putrescine transport system permease protein [Beijerinckia sp. GAS462]SEB73283.1 putrescine transport system permease protein [Beijerinckia sp. 28-YEA-48]